MAQQTRAVRHHIERLAEFYLLEGRDAALEKLIQSLRSVAIILDQPGPIAGVRRFPSIYHHLSGYGFHWFKLHVYWFGYTDHQGRRVLTNFFHETNDIPHRLLVDTDELVDL